MENKINLWVGKSRTIALTGLLLLLASAAFAMLTNSSFFYYAYLHSFVFCWTLAIGALFWLMLHHLVGATWSVVLRRLLENMSMTIIPMAILFIPVLLGIRQLYHWSSPQVLAADHLLQGKVSFLNVPFFIIRAILYFAAWIFIAWKLAGYSYRQDKMPVSVPQSLFGKTSAWGILLFALTITFASFDWLMSIDAHWYSTIFGVYVFSGSALASLAILTVFLLTIFKRDMQDKAGPAQYSDLGTLLFTFVIFWAYIAFSQYFLIWYGNIPEETIFYRDRWQNIWRYISLFLVIGHFVIPFFVLMTNSGKRRIASLITLSAWLLLMHWLDLFWLIGPGFTAKSPLEWIYFPLSLAGIGCIYMGFFLHRFAQAPMIPVNDPALADSIALNVNS